MDQRKLEDYFGYTLEDFKKSQEDDTILWITFLKGFTLGAILFWFI